MTRTFEGYAHFYLNVKQSGLCRSQIVDKAAFGVNLKAALRKFSMESEKPEKGKITEG